MTVSARNEEPVMIPLGSARVDAELAVPDLQPTRLVQPNLTKPEIAPSAPAKGWRHGAIAGALVLALVGQFSLYERLQYKSAQFETVNASEALRSPSASEFRVGSLVWQLDDYARAPALAPIRAYALAHCPGRTGLDAARCVSARLDVDIPHGNPSHEFVDPQYDPAAQLRAHLAGAPGHCVARASMLAAILLAVHVPARVLQIIAPNGVGHHAIEVWDGPQGWVVFDPSAVATVFNGRGPVSAIMAASDPPTIRLVPATVAVPGLAAWQSFYVSPPTFAFAGTLIYPEPWLYMRTGTRRARWPFRGLFANVGALGWRFGEAQRVLRAGIVLSATLLFAWSALALIESRRRRTRAAA